MASIKESDDKPDIADFKLGNVVGEGNFSRIMLATHTASGEVFALKVIEKQRIKRLRVRHPNIFNEINMEKQVLNKLRHPNIIRLYHTFQDEANLYFLLEYVEGGELLNQLIHEGNQIGVHEDLARFYLADVVNAIEYMHSNQVMHRDLKPENMVINAVDGHLKLIDFGTAKDIGEPALNGPNFVGTPEYMSPETVDNKSAGYASDIWSLGCIAFQLLAGETPFSGGSAYLTFLKVQVGRYHLPSFLSDAAQDMIQICLAKDPEGRPTIQEVKAHPFFQGVDFATHMSTSPPATQFQNASMFELIRDLKEADSQRGAKELLESCFTDSIQQKINELNDHDKALLMHLLERKQLLHLPSIYPRFFAHPSLGRCKYARHGGYVGFTHAMQNQWSDKYSFMMIGGPALSVPESPLSWEQRAAEIHRRVIGPINAQMPAFVIFCGDLLEETTNSPNYASHCEQIRLLLNEIHPEIKLVFVAGVETFPVPPSDQDRLVYAEHFGDDRFSFWHGGIKFIVINSPLIAHEVDVHEQAKEQEEWLIKELENGKLCAKETVLVSAHSFHTLVQGPELPPGLTASSTDNYNPHELTDTQKKRYVEMLAKHPPRLIVTTQGPEDGVVTVHTAVDQNASADDDSVPVLKKTQMVVCSSPLSSSRDSVMHVAHVSQSGIAISQVRVANTPSKLQDVDSVLSAEAIKLELSRASTPTTA